MQNQFSKKAFLLLQSMGLCPIAPPKGFPIALWKPSAANISNF